MRELFGAPKLARLKSENDPMASWCDLVLISEVFRRRHNPLVPVDFYKIPEGVQVFKTTGYDNGEMRRVVYFAFDSFGTLSFVFTGFLDDIDQMFEVIK